MNRQQERRCLVAAAVLQVSVAAPARADLREEFEALEREMLSVQQDYLDARQEWALAKAAGTLDEHAPEPPDVRPAVLRKMDEIVARALGAPESAYVAVQTFRWSAGVDAASALPRFQGLVRNFPQQPEIDDAIDLVEHVYAESGSSAEWTELLGRLARTTKRSTTRFNAFMQVGMIHLAAGRLAEARTAFSDVARQENNPEQVDLAKAYLFEIDHLQVGMAAPEFTTAAFDGGEVALRSLRGKVVLLNFWATWCPNCVAEFAHLKATAAALDGRPFVMLTVSMDEAKESAEVLLRALVPPGVHTWELKDGANPVAQLYNVRVLPAWFLIDGDGIIRARNPFGDKLLPAVQAVLPPAPAVP